MASKFPKVPKEAIDLLERSIMFDPRKRITVVEALDHPFFKPVRDATKEQAGESIKMSFEAEGELNEERLRELFVEEIRQFERPK